MEERLEEGERRALLKAMGVEIWRLRASAGLAMPSTGDASAAKTPPGDSPVGAPSVGAASAANTPPDDALVGAASAGGASAGGASAGGASAANSFQTATASVSSREQSSQPPELEAHPKPAADTPPRCEIHAYKLGRVLVLADVDEPAQQNRRLFQDLVRAAGGDPDKQGDPTEFVWPPAEGSLFDAGRGAALTAFAKRMRGRTAKIVTLCVGESVCEIVRGVDLGAPVVFAGALQTLRTSPEAKRNLWQALQRMLEA